MSKAAPENLSPKCAEGIDVPVIVQTPLVLALLAVLQRQEREILELRDNIPRPKGAI